MQNGFYIYFRGVDYFYTTEKKNKTDAITIDFLNKIQNHLNRFGNINAQTVAYYKKAMQRATCEIRTLQSGRQYYEITGENFSGCGTFIDDGKTVVF